MLTPRDSPARRFQEELVTQDVGGSRAILIIACRKKEALDSSIRHLTPCEVIEVCPAFRT
jgi:hypothetical protein